MFRKNFFVQHTPDDGVSWNAVHHKRSLVSALAAVPVDGDFNYRIIRRKGNRFVEIWTNQKTSEKLYVFPLD